jgi:hypothetical protein
MSSTLLPILDTDLSLVSGGADQRSGLELAYDRGKACAIGALAAQKAIPGPVPPYVKAAIGCTAGVAEQVRQEGGMDPRKK